MAAELYWGGDANYGHGIVDDVWEERERQLGKWGMQTRDSGTSEQRFKGAADEARFVCDQLTEANAVAWVDILREEVYEAFAEEDPKKLAVELVQVMAVAASWLQDMKLKGEI